MRPGNPCSGCGLKAECKRRTPYKATPREGGAPFDRKKSGKCLRRDYG